jgi:magnesium-protoporphyrin O-methyltransferase
VSDCCSPKGYRWVFSEREARREAKRYRRKGLDSTSRKIVDLLKARGVTGRTVLEVGGGIGAIQIELLKAGAARATSIELTPTYEEVAMELLRDAGLEDRVERHVMDFAEAAATVSAADIVVLNRVICCYPNMPKLAGAAADHAREVLALAFPRKSWWMRIGLTAANLMLWVTRREFHIFVHPPKRIFATCEEHGLTATFNGTGLIWTVATLRRAT